MNERKPPVSENTLSRRAILLVVASAAVGGVIGARKSSTPEAEISNRLDNVPLTPKAKEAPSAGSPDKMRLPIPPYSESTPSVGTPVSGDIFVRGK